METTSRDTTMARNLNKEFMNELLMAWVMFTPLIFALMYAKTWHTKPKGSHGASFIVAAIVVSSFWGLYFLASLFVN